MKTPDFSVLKEVSERLSRAGIVHALGGSGLLAVYGLQEGDIHDWDLTTDAPIEEVKAAMDGLEYEHIGPRDNFATEYLLKIKIGETYLDLMGSFALKTENGVEKIQTIVRETWSGIPVGCAVEWEKAYRLLGRENKAKALAEYLASK